MEYRLLACGKSKQDAGVAAAKKLAGILWKILTTMQRYTEEDEYLTARKMKRLSHITRRVLIHVTKPEDVPTLIGSLTPEADALKRYPGKMHEDKTGKSFLANIGYTTRELVRWYTP